VPPQCILGLKVVQVSGDGWDGWKPTLELSEKAGWPAAFDQEHRAAVIKPALELAKNHAGLVEPLRRPEAAARGWLRRGGHAPRIRQRVDLQAGPAGRGMTGRRAGASRNLPASCHDRRCPWRVAGRRRWIRFLVVSCGAMPTKARSGCSGPPSCETLLQTTGCGRDDPACQRRLWRWLTESRAERSAVGSVERAYSRQECQILGKS
jgi:hypothetical protein